MGWCLGMRLRGGADKPAHLIIRLLFGFASDSVFDKFNQSTNSETAMLSKGGDGRSLKMDTWE